MHQNSVNVSPNPGDGAVDLLGIAHPYAAVTVEGQAAYRKGEYYRREVPVANSNGPAFPSVANVAQLSGQTSNLTGRLLIPHADTID